MRRHRTFSLLVSALALADPVAAQIQTGSAESGPRSWQASVGVLAEEKTRAETCVSILKRHAQEDARATSLGQLDYSDGKADMDAVIAALQVALAGNEPVEFEIIEERLTRATLARENFCAMAVATIPEANGSTRLVIPDLLAKVIGPLVGAAKDIYLAYHDEKASRRATISQNLEAKKWRNFEDVPG